MNEKTNNRILYISCISWFRKFQVLSVEREAKEETRQNKREDAKWGELTL